MPEPGSAWTRLGWLIAIWLLSVTALGLVAALLRLLIPN